MDDPGYKFRRKHLVFEVTRATCVCEEWRRFSRSALGLLSFIIKVVAPYRKINYEPRQKLGSRGEGRPRLKEEPRLSTVKASGRRNVNRRISALYFANDGGRIYKTRILRFPYLARLCARKLSDVGVFNITSPGRGKGRHPRPLRIRFLTRAPTPSPAFSPPRTSRHWPEIIVISSVRARIFYFVAGEQ